MTLVVKNPPDNAGDLRDAGSIPGRGISPGEVNGHLLQYSCLENPMDRGAWLATVHGVTKSQTNLPTKQQFHCYSLARRNTKYPSSVLPFENYA